MSNGVSNSINSVLNPLSQEQLSELEDTLVDIGITRDALQKARDAGIDVSDQLAKLDQSEQQARNILKVYGNK